MKRSYAPENVSPGSLIPCVAATKVVKIKITAMNSTFRNLDPPWKGQKCILK
jgi:hypothetical protein